MARSAINGSIKMFELESVMNWVVKGSLFLIRLYQAWAPDAVRSVCKLQPTCSNYALQAIEQNGFFMGWKLTFKRLWLCEMTARRQWKD